MSDGLPIDECVRIVAQKIAADHPEWHIPAVLGAGSSRDVAALYKIVMGAITGRNEYAELYWSLRNRAMPGVVVGALPVEVAWTSPEREEAPA